MRVLGIDCGSVKTGYGVIDSDGRKHRMVAAGVIQVKSTLPLAARLVAISHELRRIMREFAPQSAAVEEVFYSLNVKTALNLAHVRGIALLLISEAGLELGEYSPMEVKTSVVGHGWADKYQVQAMVASLLQLERPLASLDACDALAVAVCHATHAAWQARQARG